MSAHGRPAFAIAAAVLFACAAIGGARGDEPAGWVNGTPVAPADWADALRFAHASEPDPAKARAAAAAACVRELILMELARAAGLTNVRDGEDLRAQHADENARRAARSAAGEPVYGPRQLSWQVFRGTWLDGLRRELLRHEGERAPPGDSELRVFYEAHPALFRARAGGVLPFHEYRDFVRRQLLEHRLEARIVSATARAEVRWQPFATE